MWQSNKHSFAILVLLLAAVPAAAHAKSGGIDLVFPPPKIDYAATCKDMEPMASMSDVSDDRLPANEAYKRAAFLIHGTKDIAANPERAAKLLETLIHDDKSKYAAKAKHQLAILLREGRGIPRDRARSIELLEEALPHLPNYVGNMLGGIYRRDGRYVEAENYYKTAAADNSAQAYFALSNMYRYKLIKSPSEGAAEKMQAVGQNMLLSDLAKGDCRALYGIAETLLQETRALETQQSGLAWLQSAAATKQRAALDMLGDVYHDGNIVKQDTVKALNLWQQAAEDGSAEAMYKLGQHYLLGSTKPNFLLAEQWLAKAVEYHHPLAGQLLVEYYRGLHGAKANEVKSFELLKLLSERSSANDSIFSNLAAAYEKGLGTEKDLKQAFTLYNIAAAKGSTTALVKLGNFYKYGKGVEINPNKSYRYYRLAAENGDRKAMKALIHNYTCGVGKPIDASQAEKWRARAVYFGVSGVLIKDIDALLKSDKPEDHQRAISLIKLASKDDDHAAMIRMSLAHSVGRGVEKNEKLAQEWLDKATKQGTDEQKSEGLMALARLSLDEKSYYYAPDMAFVYYERARKLGSVEAAYELGNMYTSKTHDLANDDKAKVAYEQAARKGHVKATFKLGRLLMKHVANTNEALGWLHKAADANNVDAMVYLAGYYATKGDVEAEQAKVLLARAEQYYPCKESLKQQIANIKLDLSSPEVKLNALKTDVQKGRVGAIRKLANYYFANEQKPTAIKLLTDASSQGNAEAMVELGNAYAIGLGIKQSMPKAMEWWGKAAALGDANAVKLLEANKPKAKAKDKYENISH